MAWEDPLIVGGKAAIQTANRGIVPVVHLLSHGRRTVRIGRRKQETDVGWKSTGYDRNFRNVRALRGDISPRQRYTEVEFPLRRQKIMNNINSSRL